MQTYKEAYGRQSYDEWVSCWAALGTDASIPAIDKEKIQSDGKREGYSAVVVNPTVYMNEQQYRGNIEEVHTPLPLSTVRLLQFSR